MLHFMLRKGYNLRCKILITIVSKMNTLVVFCWHRNGDGNSASQNIPVKFYNRTLIACHYHEVNTRWSMVGHCKQLYFVPRLQSEEVTVNVVSICHKFTTQKVNIDSINNNGNSYLPSWFLKGFFWFPIPWIIHHIGRERKVGLHKPKKKKNILFCAIFSTWCKFFSINSTYLFPICIQKTHFLILCDLMQTRAPWNKRRRRN